MRRSRRRKKKKRGEIKSGRAKKRKKKLKKEEPSLKDRTWSAACLRNEAQESGVIFALL